MNILWSRGYVIFIHYMVLHYIFYECFVKFVLSIIFGCMVCLSIYANTYSSNFCFHPPNLYIISLYVIPECIQNVLCTDVT
jgi:hypothetical protein